MSHLLETNGGAVKQFKWGIKKGVGMNDKNLQFYESFVYEGVEYFLYDCVYFYHTDHVETSVGKLVKIYERPNHEKVVKVVWFFRPCEIRNFLGDYQPNWNELLLASGVGTGVSNVNNLGSIIGKCNVICTSKDKRNPEPSKTELKTADFFFNHAFDVQRRAVVDKFPNEIDGVKVERFFNRKEDKKTTSPPHVGTNLGRKIVIKCRTDPSHTLQCQVEDKAEVRTSESVLPKSSLPPCPPRKRKIIEENSTINRSSESPKEEEFYDNAQKLNPDKRIKTCREIIEVTERPDSERRKWFKKLPWDERLRNARDSGTLVLLSNLDPSYTSFEVEDLLWHVLKEKVEARIIEWSPTFNTDYGRALVIFKTKDAAESALYESNRRCLVLGEMRVVYAEKGIITEPEKQRKFTGHLVLDRFQKQQRDMKNAVSTSHCSQKNTIEYSMATEWLQLYKKSDAWWNALYQRQMQEIQATKSKLKMTDILL
ncbi:PREDICTED: protein ANTI-SILENCING 1-like [Lupinus angustifolius]|uniref:protein ANTI-SILENCING 1-like n=1 Tax=Lupinus angustifolius TaxID=3871 RepID=UPI00092E5B3A|nr:PREDICTED: protein ANTI-SILENCING 1-like [Lupinus angustifolius]